MRVQVPYQSVSQFEEPSSVMLKRVWIQEALDINSRSVASISCRRMTSGSG